MSSTDYGAFLTAEDDEPPTAFIKKRRCNDLLFALAFLAHLGLVVTAWVTYEAQDVNLDFVDRGVWKFAGACAGVALLLSTITLFVMAVLADELVQVALVVSLACTAAVGGYGVYVNKIYMMVVGGLAFLAVLIFTWRVWRKIPVSRVWE